jgi:AraC-like DNA-binding protein
MRTTNKPFCASLSELGTYAIDERVQTILQTIDSAPAQDLTRLAQLAGLSNSRLSHLFKRETGLDLRSFLTSYRLEKAAQMLGNEEVAIKEVSYLVGYRHTASFIRAFRKSFGCTPQEYRSQQRCPQIADSAN